MLCTQKKALALMLLKCISTLLSAVYSYEEKDIIRQAVEEFKELCPYTDLCFSKANRTFEFFIPFDSIPYPCCEQCSCGENCGTDCCPDKPSHYLGKDEIQQKKETLQECIYAQFRDYNETNLNGKSYKMTSKCPKHFTNSSIRVKCKRSYQDFNFQENTKNLLPVTSLKSKVTFKNYHCAVCNNAIDSSFKFWDSRMECINDEVIFLQSFSEIPSKLNEKSQCQLLFIPPNWETSSVVESCQPLIDKCNMTEKWLEYSFDLESKCLSYSSVYIGYKNVHCFLCNGNTLSDVTDTCYEELLRIEGTSFIALLDFNNLEDKPATQKDENEACSQDERFDPLFEKCRPLICGKGFSLTEAKCVPLYKSIPGHAAISVGFNLIPTESARSLTTEKLHSLAMSVDLDAFARQSLVLSVKYTEICALTIFMKLNYTLNETVAKLFSTTNNEREIMPFVDYVGVIIQLSGIEIGNLTKTIEEIAHIFTTASYFGNFHVQYNTDDKYVPFQGPAINTDLLLNLAGEVDPLLFAMFESSVDDLTDGRGVMFLSGQNSGPLCDTITVVYPQPFCPLVQLSTEEFDIDLIQKTVIVKPTKLNYNEDPPNMSFNTILSDRFGSKYVCSNNYFLYTKHMTTRKPSMIMIIENNDSSYELVILSIVCLTVSIISSLFTLIVYCMFPRLRTVPGLNNMGIVISLLVTHTLTLVNIITNVSILWLCSMIGVMLHFSLLSNFFWMFICTYYMMRVFLSTKDRSYSSQPVKKFLKYCLIVEVSAVTLVLSTIIVNLEINDGIGYGGSSCYIMDSHLILYFVAIPLGVVLIANFIMFLVVIVNVSKSAGLAHSSTNDRNNFVIFIKLSTITGLTWAFAFIYQFTEVLVFAYANIVFNAGQGLFIMLSFVCNRRVSEMFRKLKKGNIMRDRYTTSSTNHDRTTSREFVSSQITGTSNENSNNTKF